MVVTPAKIKVAAEKVICGTTTDYRNAVL